MHDRAFDAMQSAVDIVNDSPHPTHKISSSVFNDDYIVSATNYYPELILNALGKEQRIGKSSCTVHAETAAILKAPQTDGASICITDPFCPNCAKNIAEAGIKTIYIDHKGFEKAFWEKSGDHFKNMAMEITAKAGISVYKIERKAKKITPIYVAPENYIPPEDSPIEIEPCPQSQETFHSLIHGMIQQHHNRKFVTAMVTDRNGKSFCMTARVHAVMGYTIQDDRDIETITNTGRKYSYIQEPMNRLLMAVKRGGFSIVSDYVFNSQVPTSREQVNAVGGGITNMFVGDPFRARKDEDMDAKNLLHKKEILTFKEWL